MGNGRKGELMGSKTLRGVCPDMACQEVAIERERQRSERSACKAVADRLGVPFKTVHSWVYRDKKVTAPAVTLKEKPTHETCTTDDLYALIELGQKFSTIYADPPWKYGNQATRAATSNHYGTMTIEDLKTLPIPQLVSEDAHLHLWTTNAFLFEAKEIMEAWGFQYKSCFVWVKPQMGIGNYWRVSHEFMLFGLRGKCPFLHKGQMSWQKIDRTKHSKKPEEIATTITKVSPGPFLELFGRQVRPGWVVWGNEIRRELFKPSDYETKTSLPSKDT